MITTIPLHPVGHVVATCIGSCVRCGAEDRLFVQTDGGVLSRCYQCGDERTLDAVPARCHAAAVPAPSATEVTPWPT